jgi:hypothetical protein
MINGALIRSSIRESGNESFSSLEIFVILAKMLHLRLIKRKKVLSRIRHVQIYIGLG